MLGGIFKAAGIGIRDIEVVRFRLAAGCIDHIQHSTCQVDGLSLHLLMVKAFLHQLVNIPALPPGVALKCDSPEAGPNDGESDRLDPNLLDAVLRVCREIEVRPPEGFPASLRRISFTCGSCAVKASGSLTVPSFKNLIGRLLAELGFEAVEVTRRSQDGGIDVRGTLVVGDVIRTQMAVQVKRWKLKNHVQAPVIQQVRGSLGTHEQGLVITTSDFSAGAKREAERPNAVPVALMSGEKLVELLAEYQVGIKRQAHDLFEIEEEDATDAVDLDTESQIGA